LGGGDPDVDFCGGYYEVGVARGSGKISRPRFFVVVHWVGVGAVSTKK
jgi:hypothetical protein